MTTSTHTSVCLDYVRTQINENAAGAGEITWETVLIDTDTVWGCSVSELVNLYLSDGTASCTCPDNR
jgi:hypothetical protein